MRATVLAAFVAASFPNVTSAQVPDSARADSLARDTTDYTGLFIKSQEEGRRRTGVFPTLGTGRILPPLARIVLDRDSVAWHNAETVGDLLTKVPGVFLWRGGWIGRPELPNFQGRGPASVEYTLDGLPYFPMGSDSLAVDPSLLPVSFLERVEIERLPGQLRVHLFTRRHDRLTPRSRVSVASGDLDIARYQASLERRAASGLGFVVAAEQLAVPLPRGTPGPYRNTQAWLQFGYLPSPRFGSQLQLFYGEPHRDMIPGPTDKPDTLSATLQGARIDLQGRTFYSGQREGVGPRVDLVYGLSRWHDDVLKDTVRSITVTVDPVTQAPVTDTVITLKDYQRRMVQGGVIAGYRLPTVSAEVQALARSSWTTLDLKASGGAAPNRFFSAAIEGVYQRHEGGRTSRWVTARGGLRGPLGLGVTGMLRSGSWVSQPQLLDEAARSRNDRGVLVGFDRPRLALEFGYWRTEGFSPRNYVEYPQIDSIRTSGPQVWVTVSARVAPRQWFVLDGWYSNPRRQPLPEGLPPSHSIINATIQSKFLRTFPSGTFTLKLQGSMETWGTGVLGRDSVGGAVPLKGATFFRGLLQIRLGDFIAYYDRANLAGTRLTYVPGLRITQYASTFGVRWEFSN